MNRSLLIKDLLMTVVKNAINANLSILSAPSFLKEYTSKFVFVVLVLAILAGGCIGVDDSAEDANITKPVIDKYEEYSNVDRVLIDLALAEDPIEVARSTGHLAENLQELSVEKDIVFEKDRILVLAYLNGGSA